MDGVSNLRGLISDEPVAGWSGPVVDLNDYQAAADLFLACAEPMDQVIETLKAAGRPQKRITP